MEKQKGSPKYHVISMRVSNEEKLALDEMAQHSCKSMSNLMREAMKLYTPRLKK